MRTGERTTVTVKAKAVWIVGSVDQVDQVLADIVGQLREHGLLIESSDSVRAGSHEVSDLCLGLPNGVCQPLELLLVGQSLLTSVSGRIVDCSPSTIAEPFGHAEPGLDFP